MLTLICVTDELSTIALKIVPPVVVIGVVLASNATLQLIFKGLEALAIELHDRVKANMENSVAKLCILVF